MSSVLDKIVFYYLLDEYEDRCYYLFLYVQSWYRKRILYLKGYFLPKVSGLMNTMVHILILMVFISEQY